MRSPEAPPVGGGFSDAPFSGTVTVWRRSGWGLRGMPTVTICLMFPSRLDRGAGFGEDGHTDEVLCSPRRRAQGGNVASRLALTPLSRLYFISIQRQSIPLLGSIFVFLNQLRVNRAIVYANINVIYTHLTYMHRYAYMYTYICTHVT